MKKAILLSLVLIALLSLTFCAERGLTGTKWKAVEGNCAKFLDGNIEFLENNNIYIEKSKYVVTYEKASNDNRYVFHLNGFGSTLWKLELKGNKLRLSEPSGGNYCIYERRN